MKALGFAAAAALAAVIAYLLAWPVPVEPVAWEAPENRGYTGEFEANERLSDMQVVDLGEFRGPEDVTGAPDGTLYATEEHGRVLRIATSGAVSVFAETGGRPLGIELDRDGSLVVANAYLGLQRISPEGEVTLLADRADGEPILYADDLDIAPDGKIYFSDASTRFGAEEWSGAYGASLLDILEHGGHGRVLEHDPASGETRTIMRNLDFANGVAVDPQGRFLLVAETGSYRVWKHWLEGLRAGESAIVIDNLPGFPDNVNRGRDGRYWIGLVSPRSAPLDALSGRPFLRKVVQRLPAALRPQAVPYSHVFAMNADGEVLVDLQSDSAPVTAITGACETAGALYLSSLFGARIGRLPLESAGLAAAPE